MTEQLLCDLEDTAASPDYALNQSRGSAWLPPEEAIQQLSSMPQWTLAGSHLTRHLACSKARASMACWAGAGAGEAAPGALHQGGRSGARRKRCSAGRQAFRGGSADYLLDSTICRFVRLCAIQISASGACRDRALGIRRTGRRTLGRHARLHLPLDRPQAPACAPRRTAMEVQAVRSG